MNENTIPKQEAPRADSYCTSTEVYSAIQSDKFDTYVNDFLNTGRSLTGERVVWRDFCHSARGHVETD